MLIPGSKFIHPDFTIKWHNGIDYDVDPEKIKSSKGQVCYKVLRGLDEPCSFCPAVMAMKTGKVADVVVKHGNYYVYMLANPAFDDDNNLLSRGAYGGYDQAKAGGARVTEGKGKGRGV